MLALREGAPDWSQLSEFEQLALLVHHSDSDYRFMGLMHVAYCDESEYHKAGGVWVVSGFLGSGPSWFELGRQWRQALEKEGLEKVGFHMAHCEHGSKAPYNDMPKDERERLQRVFIDIINGTHLYGLATAFETDRYKEIRGKIEAALGPYHKPYFLTFQHMIGGMTDIIETGNVPKRERIAFVFDQQDEYENLAKELYDEMMQSENIPNRHRLGSITFDTRLESVQLQAADIWAYESQRHIREVKLGSGKPRWQFVRLHEGRQAGQMRLQVLTSEGLDGFARTEGWIT